MLFNRIGWKIFLIKYIFLPICYWITRPLHLKYVVTDKSNQIKSLQITFIVTSPQHKCLGEWNSYERAPDSAEKQQTIYLWTDSAKKQQTIYIWTDSAKNCTGAFTVLQTVQKKQQQQFTYGQTVQKKQQQQFTYGQTVQKKQQQQFTYGQTVQKKKKTAIYIWTDSAKKNNNSNLHMDRQCKKKQQQQFTYGQTVQKKTTTAIYIWTDSAKKKQQQFTYGQYIFTDCTEDNVQNTHTCTQYA